MASLACEIADELADELEITLLAAAVDIAEAAVAFAVEGAVAAGPAVALLAAAYVAIGAEPIGRCRIGVGNPL